MESPECYKTGSLSRESIKKKWEIICVISKKSRAKDLRNALWCQARLMHLILLFHPMSRLRYSYFLFWLCEKNEQKEQPKQTWLDNRRPQQRFWTLQQVSRRWQTTIGEDLRRKLWSKEIEWNERKSVRSTRKRTSNDIGNGNSGQTKWSTSPCVHPSWEDSRGQGENLRPNPRISEGKF